MKFFVLVLLVSCLLLSACGGEVVTKRQTEWAERVEWWHGWMHQQQLVDDARLENGLIGGIEWQLRLAESKRTYALALSMIANDPRYVTALEKTRAHEIGLPITGKFFTVVVPRNAKDYSGFIDYADSIIALHENTALSVLGRDFAELPPPEIIATIQAKPR